tara:strand:+ start:2837 stop:3958 length:1122 start_codon:yes stop_codon:yes gene_type:complete
MPPDTEEQLVCECCETTNDVQERPSATVCDDCNGDHYYYCASCNDHNSYDSGYHVSPYGDEYCEHCFYDLYTYCEGCGEACNRDYTSYHRGYEYCEHCIPETSVLEVASTVPSSSRVADTFTYPIKTLVGLEVECITPEVETIDTPMYWTNCSDGSISTNEENSMGVELVSTPASGDLLMQNIDNLMQWRDYYGGWVNHTCGFHVHFNSIDKTPREIAHVAIVYQKYQSILKGMMPNSRQSSNWCRDSEMNVNCLRRVTEEQHLIDEYYETMGSHPSDEKYNDARYCGLNIHSRYYHGTIEFRLHSGTINKEKITNWISILNIIIDKGVEISKFSEENFRSWLELEPNTKIFGDRLEAYINKRTSKFIGERNG